MTTKGLVMIRKKRASGLPNMSGKISNRRFLNCLLYPFSALETIMEVIKINPQFKTLEFLDKEFDTTYQLDEINLFLPRFMDFVKFDFNKETRPPLRMRYDLSESKITILFDFNSKELHDDEIQLKEHLILDIVELEYRNNLIKLIKDGQITIDEFRKYMEE
jgi:hypothetical protein